MSDSAAAFPRRRAPVPSRNTHKGGGEYSTMGLGSTAKKIQKVADTAEELYSRINDVRDQVQEMQQTTIETKDRVGALESEVAEQRALLEALAKEQGIDLDSVTAEAHIEQAENAGGESPGAGSESPDADGTEGEAAETTDATNATDAEADGAATDSTAE